VVSEESWMPVSQVVNFFKSQIIIRLADARCIALMIYACIQIVETQPSLIAKYTTTVFTLVIF
jgi:hypothetical protein